MHVYSNICVCAYVLCKEDDSYVDVELMMTICNIFTKCADTFVVKLIKLAM